MPVSRPVHLALPSTEELNKNSPQRDGNLYFGIINLNHLDYGWREVGYWCQTKSGSKSRRHS